MARVWNLILLVGCVVLVGIASAAPTGEATLRVSSSGAAFPVDGAANGWIGLLVLGFGLAIGVLWLLVPLGSLLESAHTNSVSASELPPLSRARKDMVQLRPRADRRRRPLPRSSDRL